MSSDTLNQKFVYLPKAALFASAILHGGLFFLFVTAKVLDHFGLNLFRKPPIDTHSMYQDFIQVDVVALPDQMIGENVDTSQPVVETPAAEPEPVPEAKAADTMESPDIMAEKIEADKKAAEETKKKEAAEKVRVEKEKQEREKALKKLAEEASREAALKSLAKSGQKGRGQLKGNKLSQGTATAGMIGTPADRWGSLLKQKIRENFSIFQWQRKKKLEAIVFIKIYPTGRVRERRIVKPSPDSTYNASVLQAIDASQPLPIPDDPTLYEDGINLVFRPED